MAISFVSVDNTQNILEQFEEAFTGGDYKRASVLFNNNFNYIVDAIDQIITCFKAIDEGDESGFQMYWQDMLKNVTLAYKSRDMFLKYDILCCDLKDGINQFNKIIGDE